MKLNTWQCDHCKKEFREHQGAEINFHIGDDSDPVDGHNIKDYKSLDFCAACQKALLEALLKEQPAERQQRLATAWGSKRA